MSPIQPYDKQLYYQYMSRMHSKEGMSDLEKLFAQDKRLAGLYEEFGKIMHKKYPLQIAKVVAEINKIETALQSPASRREHEDEHTETVEFDFVEKWIDHTPMDEGFVLADKLPEPDPEADLTGKNLSSAIVIKEDYFGGKK